MGYMPNKSLQVLLVEDSPIISQIVTESLDSCDDIEIVSIVDTQNAAIDALKAYKPDVVIVDLELNEGNGVGVLSALKQSPDLYGYPRKIVYTNHTSQVLKRKCEALDIDAFFDKSYQFDELIDYVEMLSAR
jgi:DNA-binding NarL/FixJ family response regulator